MTEREVVNRAEQRAVEEDTRARAQDGLACAERIVSDGEAGREVGTVAQDRLALVAQPGAQHEIRPDAPFVLREAGGVEIALHRLVVEALAETARRVGEEVGGARKTVRARCIGQVAKGRADALQIAAEFEGVRAVEQRERVLQLPARLAPVACARS